MPRTDRVGSLNDFLFIEAKHERDQVVLWIKHQRSSFRGLVGDHWTSSNGWVFMAEAQPEVRPHNRIFFLRGWNSVRDREPFFIRHGDWVPLKEAVMEFNMEFKESLSLEEQFFKENPDYD